MINRIMPTQAHIQILIKKSINYTIQSLAFLYKPLVVQNVSFVSSSFLDFGLQLKNIYFFINKFVNLARGHP